MVDKEKAESNLHPPQFLLVKVEKYKDETLIMSSKDDQRSESAKNKLEVVVEKNKSEVIFEEKSLNSVLN